VIPNSNDTGRREAFSGHGERRRFGRYETLFRIAAGGMAEVYAARIVGEGGFEKVVALKRMLPNLAEDERFVTMFLDEGRVAAHISSPNVVQTLDLGRAEDDSLYLVMELVIGVPLGHLIRGVLKSGEYVDLDIAVEIIAQAATGLHDAHEATTPLGDPLKLIHRDISPQNILVDRAGRTRITDFGVARAMQSHSHTQTGEVKGKMSYFAPEQARGGELTARVDIFALGIVAWELITGRRLFKSDNPLNTLRKVTEERIPTVHEYRADIPPELGACIAKALQRDPDDRYESARAFAQAIRSAHKPARQSAVGEYVKLHGATAVEHLESGLKRALSNEPEEEATRAVLPRGASGSGLSNSAVVPTGSMTETRSETGSRSLLLNAADSAGLRPAPPESKRKGLLLGLIAVVIACVAVGLFFASRPSPSSIALDPLPQEPTPAAVTPEAEALEPDSPAMVQRVIAPEVEPAPTPRAVTMRVRRGMRASMVQTPPPEETVAATNPTMEPVVEPTMVEAQTTDSAMATPITTPMTNTMSAAEAPTGTGHSSEMTSEMSSEMSGSSMGLLMQWGDP
jgi:serine/threonine protein kinase